MPLFDYEVNKIALKNLERCSGHLYRETPGRREIDPLINHMFNYLTIKSGLFNHKTQSVAVLNHAEAILETHIGSPYYNILKDVFTRSKSDFRYVFKPSDLYNYHSVDKNISAHRGDGVSKEFWAQAAVLNDKDPAFPARRTKVRADLRSPPPGMRMA